VIGDVRHHNTTQECTVAMENFYAVLGPIMAGAIGIMALALFFSLLSGLKRKVGGDAASLGILKIKSVFDDKAQVNITLNGGKSFDNVFIRGMTSQDGGKGYGHFFWNWIVIEDGQNKKTMIKPDTIRMISQV